MADIIDVGDRSYIRRSFLGKGGFCKAFLAEDVETGKHATLRETKEDKPESRRALVNGANIYSHIDGRNGLPKLLGYEKNKMVVEYVEGDPLSRYENPPEDIMLGIAYQTASSVDCLHKTGVIHRDLKPKNLIATPTGRIVPIDLDAAMIMGKKPSNNINTYGFTSPERIRNETETQVSDLYPLGSILWTLYTMEDFDLIDSELEGNRTQSGDVSIRFAYTHLRRLFSGPDLREVISTCWRVGRSYESAEHMKVEVAERLKRKGINPKDSRQMLAAWAKSRAA